MNHSQKHMIRPFEVAEAAKCKEKENIRFRSFLKRVADPDELDRLFLMLHREIFPRYNCAKCRNCCKLMHAELPEEDIEQDAALLGMTREEFISAHLKREFGEWLEIHQPCSFLNQDGSCRLGEHRPESCKKFPYTDQPERLFSLYSFLNAVGVCPAAYEICEALKQVYGFGKHRSKRVYEPFDQTGDFSFVAGYTSWGFPYGTQAHEASEQEDRSQEASEEELPF